MHPAMPVQDTQVFITLSSIDVSVDADGAGQDGGNEGADAGFSSANAYLSNDQVLHQVPVSDPPHALPFWSKLLIT